MTYQYQGRQVDHFNITDIPASLLKEIVENEVDGDEELHESAIEELNRRCDLLDLSWEIDPDTDQVVMRFQ